jgi:hypothetical protein
MEKKLKPLPTHLSVRRHKSWPVVLALPPSLPFYYFSATQQNFLPVELKPLGLSSTGQLRVASQLTLLNHTGEKITITFWLFF